jgi:amidase
MPPMAAGGVQPGVYGHARSPYHPGYLPAAYGSGSSNGAGAATAASLAIFGMAEETLSSGRSPASNNGLVAYTPSRGLISIRGNWPLSPTCDVVVPYARSVDDLLMLLDVLVVDGADHAGDFWRTQSVVELPLPSTVRPDSFLELELPDLRGVRLGAPRMFLGDDPHKANPVVVRPSVLALWRRAAEDLTRLGAEVVPVDFPAVSHYESDRPGMLDLVQRGYVDPDWFSTEDGPMMAVAWDEFLRENAMPGFDELSQADGDRIFPDPPQNVYANAGVAFDYPRIVELAKAGLPKMDGLPGFARSISGLEAARRDDFESWMASLGIHALVFPTNADVASAALHERPEHMDAALRNGVLFSNGNRAIRHLGIPTVTVPMGRMADINMPVGLTLAGRAYDDASLLAIARTYEHATRRRPRPPMTPGLPSSEVRTDGVQTKTAQGAAPGKLLDISTDVVEVADGWLVTVTVLASGGPRGAPVELRAWTDGRLMEAVAAEDGTWHATSAISRTLPRVSPDAIVVVKARSPAGSWGANWCSVRLS